MLGLTQPMRIIFLSLTIAGLLSAAERVATQSITTRSVSWT